MENRPILNLLASELRRARNATGLTQAALGQGISYSGSFVARVERRRGSGGCVVWWPGAGLYVGPT